MKQIKVQAFNRIEAAQAGPYKWNVDHDFEAYLRALLMRFFGPQFFNVLKLGFGSLIKDKETKLKAYVFLLLILISNPDASPQDLIVALQQARPKYDVAMSYYDIALKKVWETLMRKKYHV